MIKDSAWSSSVIFFSAGALYESKWESSLQLEGFFRMASMTAIWLAIRRLLGVLRREGFSFLIFLMLIACRGWRSIGNNYSKEGPSHPLGLLPQAKSSPPIQE